VFEILQRFNEDLTALQPAIRWGEGDKLQELFTLTRAIRRSIIEVSRPDSAGGKGEPERGGRLLMAVALPVPCAAVKRV
jgi:hypothetical protein